MRASTIVEEPLVIHAIGIEDGAPRSRRRSVQAGRPRSGAPRSLSARVQRRPAAAHRPGARAGAQPVVHHRGRAGVGARRLDPGAGDQPADGPAAAAEAHLSVHRARPAAGASHLEPRRRDVSGPDRRDGATPRRSSRTRSMPTRGRCCRPCRPPIRMRRARASSSIPRSSIARRRYARFPKDISQRSTTTKPRNATHHRNDGVHGVSRGPGR